MDIGTSLTLFGFKDLLIKVAGPTADYVGNETKNLVEKSHNNIKKILNNSVKVLGSKADYPGQVSSRILKRVYDVGAFCEDDLTLEYLGGVLASSRSDNFNDERSLNFFSLLESMSSYQIKAHYIFYTILRKKCMDWEINFEDKNWMRDMIVFIPFEEFVNSMDLKLNERSLRDLFLPHIFWGLKRLELISHLSYGNVSVICAHYPEANGPGFIIYPSLFGIELYMWVNGHSDTPLFHFLDENIQFVSI